LPCANFETLSCLNAEMFVYCTNAASFFAYLKIQLSAQQAKCKQKTDTSARIRQRCCYVSVRPT